VLGAAAFLAGSTRITLAVVVLMVTVINDMNYLLPMFIVVLLGKLVGDRFNISIYDIHIELKNIPFVEA
jgi:chloride channel 7